MTRALPDLSEDDAYNTRFLLPCNPFACTFAIMSAHSGLSSSGRILSSPLNIILIQLPWQGTEFRGMLGADAIASTKLAHMIVSVKISTYKPIKLLSQ